LASSWARRSLLLIIFLRISSPSPAATSAVLAATSSAAATFPRISVSSKSGSKVNSFALSFIVVGTAIAVVVVVKGSLIVVVGITRSQIGSNYHENCVAGRQQKKGLKKYKYSVLIQSQAKSRGLLVFFLLFLWCGTNLGKENWCSEYWWENFGFALGWP